MCEYPYVGINTQEYINLCRYFYYSRSHDWQLMPWKYYNVFRLCSLGFFDEGFY